MRLTYALFALFLTRDVAAQAASKESRDVAGVTIGMSLDSAVKRLTAYGTLPAWRVDQIKYQAPQLPGKPYVAMVVAKNHSAGDDVRSELIELEFAPAPPPAPQVVTAMYRQVVYARGKERQRDVVLEALKGRFGPQVYNAAQDIPSLMLLWWYYDAKGKLIKRDSVCANNAYPQYHSFHSINPDPDFYTRMAKDTRSCGSYASVNVGFSQGDLVNSVEMVVADNALRSRRYQAMAAYADQAAQRGKNQASEAAAKRSAP
jgi:hypothetical protein